MIKVVEIQGINVTVGADWFVCENESKLGSDIKYQSDRTAMPYVFHRKASEQGVTQYTLSDEDKSLNSYSGADLVSSVISEEHFIYVYKVSEALSWVFACSEGEVVSGSDNLVQNKGLGESIKKILESLQIDVEQFSVHVDSALEVELDDFADVVTNMSDILDIADTGSLAKFYLARKKLPTKIILPVVLAAIIGAGYMAVSGGDAIVEGIKTQKVDISKLRTKLPKSSSSIRGRNDHIDMGIIKTSSEVIVEAYEEEIRWLNSDLNEISEGKLFDDIVKTLKKQNMYKGGWRSASFIFDYSQPSVYEVTWGKKPYGTSLTLSQSLQYDHISFDETGHQASSFHNTSDLETGSKKNLVKILKDNTNDLTHFMHELEISELGWYAEINPVSKRPKPIEGVKNKVVAEERQVKTSSRTFRITGKGIYNIEVFKSLVVKYDRFMVERVVVELNNKLDWVIYGVFYENIL